MTELNGRRRQNSPSVWRAADVADPSEWTFELSDAQRAEITAAARGATEAGTGAADLNPSTFLLPTLGDEVARWAAELSEGRAFQLVRASRSTS